MVNPQDVKEHMEVVGADDQPVGRVDGCEGGRIKLAKGQSAEHRYLDLGSVDRVEGGKVRLKEKAANAKFTREGAQG